ncbi:MAG: hypothetical protein II007_10355 [Gammaproteobacteria bacterium]|nr:hypothetical protein [Gammaproteobacteria bacterium]
MVHWRLVMFSVVALLVGGCDERPPATEPKAVPAVNQYQDEQVSFSYPKRWRVTDTFALMGMQTIMVEGSGDRLATVESRPTNLAPPLELYVAQASPQFRKQMAQLGLVSSSSYSAIERAAGAETIIGVEERVTVTVLGLEFPYVREYYHVTGNNFGAYLSTQTSAKDQAKAEQEFAQIRNSLQVN